MESIFKSRCFSGLDRTVFKQSLVIGNVMENVSKKTSEMNILSLAMETMGGRLILYCLSISNNIKVKP